MSENNNNNTKNTKNEESENEEGSENENDGDNVNELSHVSARTVRRTLDNVGIRGRVAVKEPPYTEAQLKLRLSFANGYQRTFLHISMSHSFAFHSFDLILRHSSH